MFTIGIDPEVIYPKIDKELLKLRIIEKEKYKKKEKEKKRKEEEKREKEKKREKGKKKNIIYEINEIARKKKRIVVELCYKKDETCYMCLESLKNKKVKHLPCGHTMHDSCYMKTIIHNDRTSKNSTYKCGLCRKSFINDNTYNLIKQTIDKENKRRKKERNSLRNRFYQENKNTLNWNELADKYYYTNYTISEIFFEEKKDEKDSWWRIDHKILSLPRKIIQLIQYHSISSDEEDSDEVSDDSEDEE